MNPRPGSWNALVPAIVKYFNEKVEPVSFKTWFEALKSSAAEKSVDMGKNPGVKLLEFFEAMGMAGGEVVLETERTVERSSAMRDSKPVGPEWMGLWLRQWGF